jgi:small-conductance mechanosensitive channel
MMPGSALIRRLLLVLGLLAWAATVSAQSAGGGADGASGGGPSEAWFEVERLNAGLPPAPETLDRSTPMGAMESFLELVRDERFGDAAHLLDLSRVPAEAQGERGPALARKLGVILENHVWIDWDALPDRPDAVMEGAAGNDPMAGQMRRSVLLERLDLGRHDVPLRLNRLKPKGQDPVWVFSRQSVGNIDALYQTYGPGWLAEVIPPEWQTQSWLSLEPWEFIGLPALILAAVGAFLLLKLLFRGLVRLLRGGWAERACGATCTPLALLAAAGLLHYATATLVTFSAPITAILEPLLIALMAIAVAVALLRGIDALLDAVTLEVVGDSSKELNQYQRQAYTSIYAARRIVLLIAFVAALGFVLTQLDLFGSLGLSLLASAGVLTVILGVAAQPVLGNIIASLQIALSQPIRIGDAVEYEGNWAYVEAIFYTFVRLRTWDDRRLVVPVQYFISKPFENWSVVEKKMTRVFLLVLDPRADVEELRQAYMEIARADEDVMEDEMLKVLVLGQDQNGVQVRFYCTARDADIAWNMHCRLREKTLAWIRDNHPDWWPRQRELQFEAGAAAEGYGRAAE